MLLAIEPLADLRHVVRTAVGWRGTRSVPAAKKFMDHCVASLGETPAPAGMGLRRTENRVQ